MACIAADTRCMSIPAGSAATCQARSPVLSAASSCNSPHRGETTAVNPTVFANCSVASMVSSVDCPLTYSSRANDRTRSASWRAVISFSASSNAEPNPRVDPADTGRIHALQQSGRRRLGGWCFRHVRSYHLAWIDDAVELCFGYEAQLQRRRLQCQIVVHSVMGDLRGLVVTDDGRKGCHQHQRALHVLVDLLQVRLGSLDQELSEVDTAVGHDCDRVGDVEDHQRLVDIHLEVAACATEAYCHVVGHHLNCDHCQCLALRWINLAGHDRGSWLILRDGQLRKPGPRSA